MQKCSVACTKRFANQLDELATIICNFTDIWIIEKTDSKQYEIVEQREGAVRVDVIVWYIYFDTPFNRISLWSSDPLHTEVKLIFLYSVMNSMLISNPRYVNNFAWKTRYSIKREWLYCYVGMIITWWWCSERLYTARWRISYLNIYTARKPARDLATLLHGNPLAHGGRTARTTGVR